MDPGSAERFKPCQSSPVSPRNEESSTKFRFIAERGVTTYKSPAERRTVRRHVMQDIGRARRNFSLRPAHEPTVQYPLEIPASFMSGSNGGVLFLCPQKETALDSNLRSSEHDHMKSARDTTVPVLSTAEASSSLHRDEVQQRLNQKYHSRSSIDRFGGGRRNLVFPFPIEMSMRKHELLDHAFNDELCKGSWLETWQMSSADPAVLYQLLYWSTLHLRCLRTPDKTQEPPEAVIYYANSVSIINIRIQKTKEAPSDNIIRLIIMLLFYNYCIDSVNDWYLHRKGLEDMIRLRGGIVALDASPSVRYLLTRVDIGGSCLQDLPPCYPLPKNLSCLPSLESDPLYSSSCQDWSVIFNTNSSIACLFQHMERVTALIQTTITFLTAQNRLPSSTINYRYVSPLLHMLLQIQIDLDVKDPGFSFHEACRLGGILYLAEIRRLLGVFPVWSTMQLRKLTAILTKSGESWGGLRLAKLWIVTLGTMEATSDDERGFFGCELRKAMEDFHLEDVEDLNTALQGFLWIDAVHGVRLRGLFTSWLNDV